MVRADSLPLVRKRRSNYYRAMTSAIDLKEAAAAYQSATQYFLNLARAVTPDLMDVHAENEWSARQCIHHMADSEAQSYARLRRLVAEPEGSVIQG